MSQQTSAIERLQSLPQLFRGADLTVRFQWTSKSASQYLYLWKRRGLVQALGGHSDVFANMLRIQSPDWGKALQMAMPSAVVTGVEELRQEGWTTQVPHRPTVAVNVKQRVFSVDCFEVSARNPRWFDITRPGINGDGSLPTLRPAWALADLLREQGWGECGLWPDDIEWTEITEQDEQDWRLACQALGLPSTELLDSAEDPRSHAPRSRCRV